MSEDSTGSADATLWEQPLASLTPEQSHALLAAIEIARQKHPDQFDILQPLMVACSAALHPNWAEINLVEYLELLWCTARYSDFCRPVRDKLLGDAMAPTPASFIEDQVAGTDRDSGTVNVADIVPATDQELQQRRFAIFAEARAAVLSKHADLDLMMDAMNVIAAGLNPNLSVITPTIYLEYLYAIAKYSDHTAPLRAELLERSVPVSTHRM